MITIKVDREIAEIDYFEIIDKWYDIIQYEFGKKIDNQKLEFYYSFGTFLPKIKTDKEEYYLNMWNETSKMLWDERLDYELSKIRVDLTLKLGKFSISDRMTKDFIPSLILDLVSEITKLKMMFECEVNCIENVKESIPQLNKQYFDLDSVRQLFRSFFSNSSTQYNMDDILDKISESGIDSLTPDEKEFLNQRSKEI